MTPQSQQRPKTPAQSSPPVLRVEGLTKSFRRGIWPWRHTVEVLKGATLTVERGELVGLVGENGSGKSTLMQIVVGLLKREDGTVERPGRLGYCPQTPMLWDKLTVGEHFVLFAQACVPMLAIAVVIALSGAGFGFLVVAVICTAMMVLMMGGMSSGGGGGR